MRTNNNTDVTDSNQMMLTIRWSMLLAALATMVYVFQNHISARYVYCPNELSIDHHTKETNTNQRRKQNEHELEQGILEKG